jgi:uncharacterized protein YciI
VSYHAVIRVPGRAWDAARGSRGQDGWDAHADFMDALAADGFVVLGGPLGEGERRFLIVCDAPDEAAVRARLAADPWSDHMLEIASVERWTILLDAATDQA